MSVDFTGGGGGQAAGVSGRPPSAVAGAAALARAGVWMCGWGGDVGVGVGVGVWASSIGVSKGGCSNGLSALRHAQPLQ